MLQSIRNKLAVVSSDHPGWNKYVAKHSHGTIFHTSEMIDVFSKTPDFSPYAYAAINPDGVIVAMLVSIHVKTLRSMPSLGSRAIQFAEPLCNDDPEGLIALEFLIQKHDQFMGPRALFCEIRSMQAPGCERLPLLDAGYELCDYINIVVDLKKPKEQLWRQVKKNMRQKINSTAKRGIVVKNDNSLEGVHRLYQLLKHSYGRSGIPLASQKLFENALRMLPAESVRIRTAFEGDKPVASIISLLFQGRVFSWYGGTLRLNGRSPFASIVWDDMAWGCEQGFHVYDFGGAGWPHEDYGPRRFKSSFGGDEVRFGRYRSTYSPLRLKMAELAYGISRRLGTWSKGSQHVDERENLEIPEQNGSGTAK